MDKFKTLSKYFISFPPPQTCSAQDLTTLLATFQNFARYSLDEARALFNKAIKPGKETLFFQTAQETEHADPQVKAFKALKKQAGKFHCLRLASLAASLRTTNAEYFLDFWKVVNLANMLLYVAILILWQRYNGGNGRHFFTQRSRARPLRPAPQAG